MNKLAHSVIAASVSATLVACSGSGSDVDANLDEMQDPNLMMPVSVISDPAPEFTMPGSFRCEDCPDSNISEFSITTPDTSVIIADQTTNAVGNGTYTIFADDGSAIEGIIDTDENGNFSVNLPLFCGRQIIKCIWSNAAGRYVLVTEAERTDCTSADIQLTLNWDDIGIDFELHLVQPGGSINDAETDCTWNTCVSTQPDWGIAGDPSDNPVKDVDDIGNFGPENIFLASPENGAYHVFVEHWNSGGDPEADGSVTFNVAGETTVTTIEDLAPFSVWYVGTIDWPSGNVTLENRRLDCSEFWASGCTLNLPAEWPTEQAEIAARSPLN